MFRKLAEATPSSLEEHTRNLIGPDRSVVIKGIALYRRLLYGCAGVIITGVAWAGAAMQLQGWELLILAVFGLIFAGGALCLIYVTRKTRSRRTSLSEARQALMENSVLREIPGIAAIALIIQLAMPNNDLMSKIMGSSVGTLAYCAGAQLCYVMILLSDTPRPRRRTRAQTLLRRQKVTATVRVRY